MADRAPKACRYPGCGRAVGDGTARCGAHPYYKASTKVQGRGDAAWKRVRLAKLAAEPFCMIRLKCNGVTASAVDHKIPVYVRPDLRLDWDNLQSCCPACNNAKRDIDRKTNWSTVPAAREPLERIEF